MSAYEESYITMLKERIVNAIIDETAENHWSRIKLAKMCRVTRARIVTLFNRQYMAWSVGELVDCAICIGICPEIRFHE